MINIYFFKYMILTIVLNDSLQMWYLLKMNSFGFWNVWYWSKFLRIFYNMEAVFFSMLLFLEKKKGFKKKDFFFNTSHCSSETKETRIWCRWFKCALCSSGIRDPKNMLLWKQMLSCSSVHDYKSSALVWQQMSV